MNLFISVVAVVLAVNALVVAIVALRAPQGYEDENGFHLGRAPEDSEIGSVEDGHFTHQEAA
jgi:hypothetical protein